MVNGKAENSWYRVERCESYDENREPICPPIYPTTKAIMQYCLCSEQIREYIFVGAKYDEYYFENLLAELRMEGRISPKQNDVTDEIIGWEFKSYVI
jgi:hypothetical protein